MSPDQPGKAIDADREQRASDRVEETWDRALAKGDDEFFDSAKKHRASDSKGNDLYADQQQPRRRGRRM